MGSNIHHGAYALFLGCTIPARSRNYEMSARKVAEAVGLELVDLPEFTCCGFPLKAMEHKASLLTNGRNLSFAEEKGLNIVSLCSSCTSALTEDALELNTNDELRKEINAELSKIGRQYNGTVRVKHFARVLWEEVGVDRIKKAVNKDLSMLRVAVHYGCHYLKPSDIYDGFDSVENPVTLDQLVELPAPSRLIMWERKNAAAGR